MPKRAERAVNCAIILQKSPKGVTEVWWWRTGVLDESLNSRDAVREDFIYRSASSFPTPALC